MTRKLVFLCLAFCLAFLIVVPASAAANVWAPWGKDTGDTQTSEILPALPDVSQTKIADNVGVSEIKSSADIKAEGWRRVATYHITLHYSGDYEISPRYRVPARTHQMFFEMWSPPTGDFILWVKYKGIWYKADNTGTGGYESLTFPVVSPGQRVRLEISSFSGYGTAKEIVWKHG